VENIEFDERVLFVVIVRPLEADLRPQRMVVARVCKEKRERQKGDCLLIHLQTQNAIPDYFFSSPSIFFY